MDFDKTKWNEGEIETWLNEITIDENEIIIRQLNKELISKRSKLQHELRDIHSFYLDLKSEVQQRTKDKKSALYKRAFLRQKKFTEFKLKAHERQRTKNSDNQNILTETQNLYANTTAQTTAQAEYLPHNIIHKRDPSQQRQTNFSLSSLSSAMFYEQDQESLSSLEAIPFEEMNIDKKEEEHWKYKSGDHGEEISSALIHQSSSKNHFFQSHHHHPSHSRSNDL